MRHGVVVAAAVAAVVGLSPGRAAAWNDRGHMVVAEIAFRRLGLAERARAVQILKDAFAPGPAGLTRFEADLTVGLPKGSSVADHDHHLFVKAATWPDVIRDKKHPLFKEFHESRWHFINFPFAPPGDAIKLPKAPTPTPPGMDPRDVIAAIRKCAADVKNPATSKRDRAARLCFLLHTVGDIHQPLHASAMFSTDKLPDGDLGGNLLLVRVLGDTPDHDRVTSIHSLFDGLLGHDTRLKSVREAGERLAPAVPSKAFAAKASIADPAVWAKESFADAVKIAYLDGKIEAVRGMSVSTFLDQRAVKVEDVPAVPANYEQNALVAAERRVALGGFRLADALTEALAAGP